MSWSVYRDILERVGGRRLAHGKRRQDIFAQDLTWV